MAKVDAAVDGEVLSSSAPPNHGMNTMTQGPVEARSLSSITTVASNPPSYPRNPTQKKLDPLELYIVRVPGSKGEKGFIANLPLRFATAFGGHLDSRNGIRAENLANMLDRCVPVASQAPNKR